MRKLAVFMLPAILSFASVFPAYAQKPQKPISVEENARLSAKAAKKQQKAMKKAAKKQRKAMIKNAKAQQKAMKKAQRRAH